MSLEAPLGGDSSQLALASVTSTGLRGSSPAYSLECPSVGICLAFCHEWRDVFGEEQRDDVPFPPILPVWLIPVGVNLAPRTRGSVCEVTTLLSHFPCCRLWEKVPVSLTEWGGRFYSLSISISWMEFCIEICLFSPLTSGIFLRQCGLVHAPFILRALTAALFGSSVPALATESSFAWFLHPFDRTPSVWRLVLSFFFFFF